MINAFATEVEGAHKWGECLRAAAGARAAGHAHRTHVGQRRTWLPRRAAAAPTARAAGPVTRPGVLGRGWVAALLGRPA